VALVLSWGDRRAGSDRGAGDWTDGWLYGLQYPLVPDSLLPAVLCCAVLCICSDFGYEAALPAPTGAGENWGPAPGAPDAFGAAPGFEAATGEPRSPSFKS
jgi:hypothetical protein